MSELIINRDTVKGRLMLRTVRFFEKEVNRALKIALKGEVMPVKNLRIHLAQPDTGRIDIEVTYDTLKKIT